MSEWLNEDLRRIAEADDLHIKGSPNLSPMIGGRARSATVKVIPREPNAG